MQRNAKETQRVRATKHYTEPTYMQEFPKMFHVQIACKFTFLSTVCKLEALQKQVDLKRACIKIGDFIESKGE